MTNYEMLLKTINSLKCSQGFYSRLARDINEMSDEERKQLEEHVNSQPQFKDEVDVIFFLEC